MTIPNNLTIIRLSLIPIFVVVFYLPGQWRYLVTATIFSIAALTDWLDGYLARRLHQESIFGEFLDPVADKLIVAVALVLLVQRYGSPFLAIPAAIIIGREIAISALREWMAELGKRASVAVSWLGKLKTVLQMIAIIFLLSQEPRLGNKIIFIGYVLLHIAAIITLWTMIVYLRAAWKELVK